MKFFSAYNYPESKAEPPCPTCVDDYQFDVSTNKLVKVGTIPFYERIQSHADSCRLDRKIEQYRAGNTLALGLPSGEYGDFTNQPNDLAQVLQARNEAREQFGNLSPAIRAVFGDDYDEFTRSLQDGTYESKLAQYAAGELAKLGNIAGASKDSGNNDQNKGGN